MGHGRMGTEKAKDFSGAIRKLLGYMKRYKGRIAVMLIFAVAGTAFNIAGPKILGKATTELFPAKRYFKENESAAYEIL